MEKIKTLWINPSFLDYRIPLYSEIYKRLNKDFYLIYSKERIPERCHNKIIELLGTNALYIEFEKNISFGVNNSFANKGVRIPFPKGLYKRIKETQPDIIIAEGFFQFTPWAVWYSLIHRKPLLIAYERTAHTERNCPFYRRWYRKIINLFVDGYVVNGSLTKEYLVSQGVKPEVIFTGAMCADSIGLSKETAKLSDEDKQFIKRELIGKLDQGLTYIFVGQMIPRKGVNELLNAWNKHCKKYTEDKLLLVGDGIQMEELKENFGDNKSLIFTSNVDYSEIHKYYAIADIFIIPTLEDNWSLVVPEAMACGLPIACSIYNGCHPELVKEGINGKTFDPLKQESIINVLEYFHTKDLQKMGKSSIEIEKIYNPENTAENIIYAVNKIYNK